MKANLLYRCYDTIGEAVTWLPDMKTLLWVDIDSGIEEYGYSCSAKITWRRTVVQVPPEYGVPDGMTIDADGLLWVAHWGGFGVYIWDPDTGKLVDKVDVPAPNVASCTFGGIGDSRLFITTALDGLSDMEREEYPLSGSVFVVDVPKVVPGENHYPFITD